MRNFNYFQPTKLWFGSGRINDIGKAVSIYGKRCLLVTVPEFEEFRNIYKKVKMSLAERNIEVAHFDRVLPNPTTDCIREGTIVAKKFKADVILGLGGGSSIDTAKAIAVEVTHDGSCWDYLGHCDKQPTKNTLPIIAVSTTSGTGSQVSQVSVITNAAQRDKSAIFNENIFPKIAIVDPQLMISLPPEITAQTGFDAFCHSFESYIHPAASPYTDLLAIESISLVKEWLPIAFKDGNNLKAREAMAWADTLGGLCLANAGVTLPHGVGMAISGMYPSVAHGKALASVYPNFMRYTWKSAERQFATLARIFNKNLNETPDAKAAEKSCEIITDFIIKLGLDTNIKDVGVLEEEIYALAKQSMVLPDYRNNPRLIKDLDEMKDFIAGCYFNQ